MKILKFITVILFAFWTVACTDFMEPQLDSFKSPEYVMKQRDDFKGTMYNAYMGLPSRINFAFEAATDNAVTNTDNTSPSKAARGSISKINNELYNVWISDYTYINRLNWFLDKMVLDPTTKHKTPVIFNINQDVNMQEFRYYKGEAFFLRAWYEFDLLQKYGGVADDGIAYGFPISTNYLEVGDNLDLPRNTYQECADQIAADCDSAVKYLPMIYSKASGILADGTVNEAGHASGIAAKALKARAYLYAASPAYNVGNNKAKWEKAAQACADAINFSNGNPPAVGFDDLLSFANYFNKTKLNNKDYSNKDMLFRGTTAGTAVTTYESENFPPRANGAGGYYNPTQNLVDAFPMKDGFPRGVSPTNAYDPENVHVNRDPRLDLFIVRTGEVWASQGAPKVALTINTKLGGEDAFGSDVKATRTGYYLQKLLDGTVNLHTTGKTTTAIAPILLGKPELYLNFAEAALNATDNPDDKKFGYSAREVLAKIRNRALGTNNDKYLATVTTASEFLQVIKNERRCELCFEDHRFWDLRRWSTGKNDLSYVNQPAYGIYSASPVEVRAFKSPYMPLPYAEILKTMNLVNNAGWEQ